jgi:hypothetical protein
MRVVATVPVGKSPHGVFMLKSGTAPPGLVPVRAASTAGEQK